MADALEKLKRLEKYLAAGHSADDPVLGMTIDKLLAREIVQTHELQARLKNQLAEFERQHALKSDAFHARYQNGDLGDEIYYSDMARRPVERGIGVRISGGWL